MDSNSDTDDADEFILQLDTIPPEMFLHICSFISAEFVINVLSKVCQRFYDIIQNDTIWRMRIFEKWPKQYPLIPGFIFKYLCMYFIRK